ncbi:hypothetical protein TNCV_3452311 [Trichonephila clavipes]|nr:hypothetical protein TNCV_3452311 [Trichonephila clavipes]
MLGFHNNKSSTSHLGFFCDVKTAPGIFCSLFEPLQKHSSNVGVIPAFLLRLTGNEGGYITRVADLIVGAPWLRLILLQPSLFSCSFLCTGKEVILQWIPSYCDIHGNEQTDKLAKEASKLHPPCLRKPLPNAKGLLRDKHRHKRISTLSDLAVGIT